MEHDFYWLDHLPVVSALKVWTLVCSAVGHAVCSLYSLQDCNLCIRSTVMRVSVHPWAASTICSAPHPQSQTLYHNTFGTRPLFPSSAENWRPFCSGRHSLMRSDNVLCSICSPVAQYWSVTMYWLLQTAGCWHCTVVLQQQCDSAT